MNGRGLLNYVIQISLFRYNLPNSLSLFFLPVAIETQHVEKSKREQEKKESIETTSSFCESSSTCLKRGNYQIKNKNI